MPHPMFWFWKVLKFIYFCFSVEILVWIRNKVISVQLKKLKSCIFVNGWRRRAKMMWFIAYYNHTNNMSIAFWCNSLISFCMLQQIVRDKLSTGFPIAAHKQAVERAIVILIGNFFLKTQKERIPSVWSFFKRRQVSTMRNV